MGFYVWIKPTRKAFANGNLFLSEALFAMGMGHTTRQNAEFVVLGRRGTGKLSGLLLGSVSQKVVQLVGIPCLIVS